jgi:transcriptional regulator with XRE-family HTH domain
VKARQPRPEIDAYQSLTQYFGDLLRWERKARGLKLTDIAVRCGTTPQTIQRLETDNMTLSTEWLDKIIAAIGMDRRDLILRPDVKRVFAEAQAMARKSIVAELRERADIIEKRYADVSGG